MDAGRLEDAQRLARKLELTRFGHRPNNH